MRCAARIQANGIFRDIPGLNSALHNRLSFSTTSQNSKSRRKPLDKGHFISRYNPSKEVKDPSIEIFRDVVGLRKHEPVAKKGDQIYPEKDDSPRNMTIRAQGTAVPKWKREMVANILADEARNKEEFPEDEAAEDLQQFKSDMKNWDTIRRMRELILVRVPFVDKLNLLEMIWPEVVDTPEADRKATFEAAREVLRQLLDLQAAYFREHTTVRLFKMLDELDGQYPKMTQRSMAILSLGKVLLRGEPNEKVQKERLTELIDIWKHISCMGSPSSGKEAMEFDLPNHIEAVDETLYGRRSKDARRDGLNQQTAAILCMFPNIQISQAKYLQSSLLMTLAILMDPTVTPTEIRAEAMPLIHLAAVLFKEVGPPTMATIERLWSGGVGGSFDVGLHDFSRPYMTKMWDRTAMEMEQQLRLMDRAAAQEQSVKKATAHIPLATLHRQLRQAHRSRNVGAALQVFDTLRQQAGEDVSLRNQLQDEPELLNYVIFVWGALRRHGEMKMTLTLMQTLRIEPTIKTYTAMMHGWKMSRDFNRSEALWNKIKESQMPLDLYIWTARISTLLEMGQAEKGMQALVEMMYLWKSQAPNAVEPNIEVVNAVFKTLILLDRKAAQELLAWASREGMEPSIVTYNILLGETFRSNPEGVPDILRNMRTAGIEPDSATFTIILEAVLGAMTDATAEEQVLAVDQIFDDIESAGLRPNQETLAKMLYSICTLPNGSDAAIQRVLAKVPASGYVVTPHMITILIEHVMRREPPDIEAVESLLKRYDLHNVNQGDQTLWERVMSAYAVCGDADAALNIFDELDGVGRTATSLPCLTDLLNVLVDGKTQRLADAKRIVTAVIKHKVASTDPAGGKDGRYWRHHFWFRARALDLIEQNIAPAELSQDELGSRDWQKRRSRNRRS